MDARIEAAGVLYVGTHRFIAAIDVQSGLELWRTKLPKGSGTLCILFSAGCLIASASGHVFRLAVEDGRILWHNDLPGMGLGLVTLAMEGIDTQQAAAHTQKQAEDAANSG